MLGQLVDRKVILLVLRRHHRAVLHHRENQLPLWFLEAIGTYTSMLNGCDYSATHHLANTRRLVDDDVVTRSPFAHDAAAAARARRARNPAAASPTAAVAPVTATPAWKRRGR